MSRSRTLATLMTVGALVVASATAGADPQRAPAPPTSPTAVPNPDRDPVPPRPVCKPGQAEDCRSMCLGCGDACTPPQNRNGRQPRNPQACDEVGRANNVAGLALKWFEASCNPGPAGVSGGPVGDIPTVAVAPFWAGCYDLGKFILDGQGLGAPDAAKARGLFARACGMAGPSVTYEACFALGQMAEAGTGGAKDVGAALDAYKKACDGSYPRACQAHLRLQPASRAPSNTPPGTTPSSIPAPPRPPPPRGAPAPHVQ